ncbi:DUF2924 domain-containing protein [Sphingorhabdus soli]|uniref:DUF2924 domain-containing protein n=1 Tax=Flavisphingopyxis soli TaxID=2601267 RepID=A0A5C6UK26_9SPHN|nr:DUF2924 domain-containing protein [Sphingorhabdus soli]TXC73363.1 DUF2924 domain-containing protein [Sphingorhabdus soli]
MSRLDDDLAAVPGMSAAQLRGRWEQLGEGMASRVPPSLLRSLLAQRLQERRHGALPALVARELQRIASGSTDAVPHRPSKNLTPGTRLVREWNGKTVSVDVLDDGFAHDNRTWRSLSEIARHVTGAHWSGPRFFGVTANGR